MLARCDTFLPSGDELTLLTEATTPEAAISEILGLGVTAIVVKNGAEGAIYHDAGGSLERARVPGRGGGPDGRRRLFRRHLHHLPPPGPQRGESLGLRQRRRRQGGGHQAGPMEGTSSFAQLDALRSGAGAPSAVRRLALARLPPPRPPGPSSRPASPRCARRTRWWSRPPCARPPPTARRCSSRPPATRSTTRVVTRA